MFIGYLKMKRKALFVFLAFAVIYAATFVLFRLPLTAVLYPTALCLVCGAFFVVSDYLSFKKRHEILEDIKKNTDTDIAALPLSNSVTENDCREIISLLKEKNFALENDLTLKYRDMTEYYSVWAHQIKTPIASMKLSLQNEDSPLSRKLTSDLLRIDQYVEMVLAFLRLDSASTDYVFKKSSIDAMVRQSVKKFAPDFINKKIRLEYLPCEGSTVTDEKWFCFVLEQLLSNALKYTANGSVKIYLTEAKTLCIADTGIGIAPEDLPRIFDKGYTGINGRVDKSASGIGLYLCKRICKNLSIDLSAQSEPGVGTVMMLDLEQYVISE